jgi:ribosome-binding protein aMBF1 (putative translation factor)
MSHSGDWLGYRRLGCLIRRRGIVVNHKRLWRIYREEVRTERERKDLSQEQLGFDAGLDRTYVSGIERGVRNAT